MRRTQNFAGDNGNAYAEMEDPVGVRQILFRENETGKTDNKASSGLTRFTGEYKIVDAAVSTKEGRSQKNSPK